MPLCLAVTSFSINGLRSCHQRCTLQQRQLSVVPSVLVGVIPAIKCAWGPGHCHQVWSRIWSHHGVAGSTSMLPKGRQARGHHLCCRKGKRELPKRQARVIICAVEKARANCPRGRRGVIICAAPPFRRRPPRRWRELQNWSSSARVFRVHPSLREAVAVRGHHAGRCEL